VIQRAKRQVGAAFVMAAVLAAGASPALATQVFNGNFNGENGGASAANILGFFTNFGGLGGGAFDLFHSGDGGVTCGAGYTSCLSLESSDGHFGQIGTLNNGAFFTAQAGDTVTMSFELSGNQRTGTQAPPDRFNAGFMFDGNVDLTSLTAGGAWIGTLDPPNAGGIVFGGFPIAATTGFQLYTLSFVAPQNIKFFMTVKGGMPGVFTGSDGRGPILDYVALDITSPGGGGAPEPATWAMMLLGFGGLGAALRRRRVGYA
jgi:hypothetical protein